MPTIQLTLSKPHPAQQKVLAEAKRFNVLQCGRRFGKTKLGTNLLLDTALRGYPAGWFAPTTKYLTEVWHEVVTTLAPLNPEISVQHLRIRLQTGGMIEFWSLDKPDAGRSRKYKRVIVDEGSVVRDLQQVWQDAIRPTLADLKGDAWFFGTPKGRNFFHQLYARGEAKEDGWASWRMPTVANPYIDPNEVEAARKDMPPSAFNQEFLGIPADDGGNPFGINAIRECVRPISTRPAVAYGIDLAKSQDWTVVIGQDEFGQTCYMDRWQSDWGQTTRKILDLIGHTPTLVDSTGVGDPIVEDLVRERATVEGFKFTSSSKQQLMEGLAASIQRTEIGIPEGWLVNELESFEYTYYAGGVRYSAPEGLHDDGVCALALCDRKRKLIGMNTLNVRMFGEQKPTAPTKAQDDERRRIADERLWQTIG
jgi:hypothetical protein